MLGYKTASKPLAIVSSGKPCSVLNSDEESDVEEEISSEASLGGIGG